MGLHCFEYFERQSSGSPLGYALLFLCFFGLAWLLSG